MAVVLRAFSVSGRFLGRALNYYNFCDAVIYGYSFGKSLFARKLPFDNTRDGISMTLAVCKRRKEIYQTKLANISARASKKRATIEKTLEDLIAIEHLLRKLEPLFEEISRVCPEYDFSEEPSNGYRTFIAIIDAAVVLAHGIVQSDKVSLYEELAKWLTSMLQLFLRLVAHRNRCLPNQLLSDEDECSISEVLGLVQLIDQVPFYNSFFGLQYDDSLRKVLNIIVYEMTRFSEKHYGGRGLTTKFCKKSNRAVRLVRLSHHSSVSFIKAFWKSSEHAVLSLYTKWSDQVAVCQPVVISPEPLSLIGTSGHPVSIPVPMAHVGAKSLSGLLISSTLREGMKPGASTPKSRYLIFHIHGGGFISQSAKSQECFLRSWATDLGVPIFSIDYSLAPEAPFPRALEDVFYAYCWVLNNSSELGTTAERIILAGDSAGGNLALGIVQACIDMEIPLPHGLALAYVPVMVSFNLSPSRMLGLMDCLLPFGFMMRCSEAYAGEPVKCDDAMETLSTGEIMEDEYQALMGRTPMPLFQEKYYPANVSRKKVWDLPTHKCNCSSCKGKKVLLDCPNLKFPSESFEFTLPRDRYLSPYLAPDSVLSQFPPIKILSSSLDPCLDECIMFAKKLRALGKNIRLDVVEGLPHGFLNFRQVSYKANEGSDIMVKRIKELLDATSMV